MITVKETKDWQRVIEACFANDADLIEQFHVAAPCTVKEAAHNTFNVLRSGAVHPDFTMYKLMVGTELIGFFGTELGDKFLTTFCIKKEFRKPTILEEFWTILNRYLADTFRTALYAKNTRAIKFMTDNGAEVVDQFIVNGHDAVLLELNWGE